MLIKSINKKKPILAKNIYCAENVTIIGDVIIEENTSIWFNVVIRGDVSSIKIGKSVNIQDGVVIHATYNKSKTIIGDNVSVGHNSILHGCNIYDNVLIGMGSIIMDNTIIKSNSIIAAGSVVLENSIVEEGCLYAGTPAVKVKKLSTQQIKELIQDTAKKYVTYSNWFKI